jgi:hypothetical protein
MPGFCQNVAMFKVCVMIVSLRHGEALVANKAEKNQNNFKERFIGNTRTLVSLRSRKVQKLINVYLQSYLYNV